ncbi:polyketide cyclase [Trinickia dabaoshanensis]|uniref:Polyketide cyclase n=1 Tax=Trinickia dabaoshanensis TaxID=564714 RepID=A0A2N7VEC7_9BURK|nr:nuclear transport factor 2 family protein [Trinickia dabaoshanensis]PMS15508.1 polyketide cyclase [Trinickia dabaoshanensis]
MESKRDTRGFAETISQYLTLLEQGDTEGIVALFTEDAQIYSPFLGWMTPAPFFTKVREASGQSRITPIDTLVSISGNARAIGYFTYDWGLKDGTQVSFDCCDVFDFSDDGRIRKMTIIYDTYPIRVQVGDKYQ